MNPIYADIFIVPNPIGVYDFKTNAIFCFPSHSIRDLGLQVCFEAVIIYDDYKNINAHVYGMTGKSCTQIVPIELFLGKKEGDIVKLVIDSNEVIVTCDQLKYKYANQGSFETTLYELTKSFYNLNDEKNYQPALSKRTQMALLIVTHERYARSVGFEPIEPTKFRYASNYIDQCKIDALAIPYICPHEQVYLDAFPKKKNVSYFRMLDNFLTNKIYSWTNTNTDAVSPS